MMNRITYFVIAIILLLAIAIKLPMNRFIPEQTGQVMFSIVEPISLLSGQGYAQIRGEPDVWFFKYQFCSFLSWCVELINGDNALEAIISPKGRGVELNNIKLIGNNQLLRDIVPAEIASFDLIATADEISIPDLVCPAKDLYVVNGFAKATKINVLGAELDDINASISGASTELISVLVSGSIEGQLVVHPGNYTGRFKALSLPQGLTSFMSPQEVATGWSVSGSLICGA